MITSLQTFFGLSATPERLDPIVNQAGEHGLSYGWEINSARFSEVVQFLLTLPWEGGYPSDANVMDAKDFTTLWEIDGLPPRVRKFGDKLLEITRDLSPSSILTVNFEEPPSSVHMYMPDAARISHGDDADDKTNLFVSFTDSTPPAWLQTPSFVD